MAKAKPVVYSVHPAVSHAQAMVENLAKSTGRPLA